MTRRIKTAGVVVGLIGGAVVIAMGVTAVFARPEPLEASLSVTYLQELSEGRLLVRPAAAPAVTEQVEGASITRYPLGFAVVHPGGDAEVVATGRALEVSVCRLAPRTVAYSVRAFGEVRPSLDARPAAERAGIVVRVHGRAGEGAQAGEPLVELDAREADLALRRARAQQAQARARLRQTTRSLANLQDQLALAEETLAIQTREYERWLELSAQNVTSRDRLDQAERARRVALGEVTRLVGAVAQGEDALVVLAAEQELAAAGVELAELEVARCVVRAPFDGVWAEVGVEEGDPVRPREALGRWVALSPAEVRVHVREGEAARLAVGAAAEVALPGVEGARATGRVVGIAAWAEAGTRTFAVDVEVGVEGWRAGSFARVELSAGELEGVWVVPDDAVSVSAEGASVFVVEGEGARRCGVELGERVEGGRVVRAGLEGESLEVVRGELSLLYDGASVRVREE